MFALLLRQVVDFVDSHEVRRTQTFLHCHLVGRRGRFHEDVPFWLLFEGGFALPWPPPIPITSIGDEDKIAVPAVPLVAKFDLTKMRAGYSVHI